MPLSQHLFVCLGRPIWLVGHGNNIADVVVILGVTVVTASQCGCFQEDQICLRRSLVIKQMESRACLRVRESLIGQLDSSHIFSFIECQNRNPGCMD